MGYPTPSYEGSWVAFPNPLEDLSPSRLGLSAMPVRAD